MSDNYKGIIEDINAAFAKGDTEGFLDHCTEDVMWMMAGDRTVKGKTDILEYMKQGEGCEPPRFWADRIFVDGDSAACYGDMTMKETNGPEKEYHYCDIYRFDGSKVSELRSYVVAKNGGEQNG